MEAPLSVFFPSLCLITMDTKHSPDISLANSVPFPTDPSTYQSSISVSGLPLPQDFYASSRLSHDSISLHRSRQARSLASSTYSYRARPTGKQLSPVVEETDDRSRRWSPPRLPPGVETGAFDDTFVEDVAIAMIAMMPSPRVEARKQAERRRRSAKRSRRVRARGIAKRVVGAAGRAISALSMVLHCPPWGRRH